MEGEEVVETTIEFMEKKQRTNAKLISNCNRSFVVFKNHVNTLMGPVGSLFLWVPHLWIQPTME